MTPLDIEFYCFAACVIGFPLATAWGGWLAWKLRRERRECRQAGAIAGSAYAKLHRTSSDQLCQIAEHKTEAEKWKGRAKAGEKSAQLFAKRLQDAQAELDALKNPPRGERGRFVGKAKVAAE